MGTKRRRLFELVGVTYQPIRLGSYGTEESARTAHSKWWAEYPTLHTIRLYHLGSLLATWQRSLRQQPLPIYPKSRDYTIERHTGSANSGCWGSVLYKTDTTHASGVDLEEVLGRELPTGTVVRVTAQIIKPAKQPKRRCDNPWPSHYCDDGIHHGAFGKKTVPEKKQ